MAADDIGMNTNTYLQNFLMQAYRDPRAMDQLRTLMAERAQKMRDANLYSGARGKTAGLPELEMAMRNILGYPMPGVAGTTGRLIERLGAEKVGGEATPMHSIGSIWD